MTQRPELRKDANGLLPGEAQHGVPDFLRRAGGLVQDWKGDAATNPIVVSPATDPQETAPSWAPPWSTNS